MHSRSYNVRMSIYIDPPVWPAHGTVFSHLVSDVSLAELHEFAATAGISERAFDRDHYDVPAHRYEELVRAGAIELSGAELTRTLIASGLRIPLKERPEKIRPRLLRAWEAAFAPRLERAEASAAPQTQLTAQVAELGERLLQAWEQPHRAYHHSARTFRRCSGPPVRAPCTGRFHSPGVGSGGVVPRCGLRGRTGRG